MEVDKDSGRGWSGLVLVAVVAVTVLGGVLLTMSDARRAVPVSSVTEALPSPTLTPTPTVVPTERVVTVSLPSPSPLPPSPASPDVTLTLRPTVKPTSTPEPQPSATPEVILESCTPPSGWVPYKVRLGDTLFSLSRQSGASLDEVREANCLSSDVLYPGSVLYLPTIPVRPMPGCGPPMDWVLYTVQRGDTLYSLATRRGATVSEVLFANCLTSVSIRAGLGLYLPSGSTVPGVAASPTPATASPVGTVCLITSPADGSQVSGAITLVGSATTEQFLFYKVEVNGPQTGGSWASLLGNVVHTPVINGVLGTANLGGWEPGSYSVRLVVVDTTSNEVAACYLGLEVSSP